MYRFYKGNDTWKIILKLNEQFLFKTLQKVVPHFSLANYHLWWIFTKCKAGTNCYGTITSSLLLWFIYYSHSKGTCVMAKHTLDSLMCSIIQWCAHWVKHPDLSRDTLYSGCNNPVITTGMDDLQHACVGFEALWMGREQDWLQPIQIRKL